MIGRPILAGVGSALALAAAVGGQGLLLGGFHPSQADAPECSVGHAPLGSGLNPPSFQSLGIFRAFSDRPFPLEPDKKAQPFTAGIWFQDSNVGETCYVVERSFPAGGEDWHVVAVLPADSNRYLDLDVVVAADDAALREPLHYRIYAASSTARSDYLEVQSSLGPYESPPPTPHEGTPTPTVTAPGRYGDVNCSGEVDAVDALVILRFIAALPIAIPPECHGFAE